MVQETTYINFSNANICLYVCLYVYTSDYLFAYATICLIDLSTCYISVNKLY